MKAFMIFGPKHLWAQKYSLKDNYVIIEAETEEGLLQKAKELRGDQYDRILPIEQLEEYVGFSGATQVSREAAAL